jgi:hypothetical protein
MNNTDNETNAQSVLTENNKNDLNLSENDSDNEVKNNSKNTEEYLDEELHEELNKENEDIGQVIEEDENEDIGQVIEEDENEEDENEEDEDEEDENEEDEDEEDENEEDENEEDENEEDEEDNESDLENGLDNILFIFKINDKNMCYCNNIIEVNKALEFFVNQIKNKYILEGYNVYDSSEKWTILDKNRITTKIYGNKQDNIMFCDILLSTFEIELVLKYNEELFSNMNLL